MTNVRVDATDPDDFPVPLRTELTSETGVFADHFASETTFACGAPGPVEICVRANDGDPECDERSCTTVQCPSEIRENLCPMLPTGRARRRCATPSSAPLTSRLLPRWLG